VFMSQVLSVLTRYPIWTCLGSQVQVLDLAHANRKLWTCSVNPLETYSLHTLPVPQSLTMLPLAFLLSTALTAALLAFFAFWQRRLQKAKIASSTDSSFAPYTSATYPILGSLQYFSGHWEFLRTATKDGAASFHLARQQCIAVPVEKRQEFFSDSRPSSRSRTRSCWAPRRA
jgi:hypothetical protein